MKKLLSLSLFLISIFGISQPLSEKTGQQIRDRLPSSGTFTTSGNIGGFTKKVTNTITTNTVAYSAGDCIGGVITVPNALRTSSGTAIWSDFGVYSTESQSVALVIDVWSASPTGTFTNNSPMVINDATNWLGTILVATTDYTTTGTISRASLKGLGLAVFAGTGTSLFLTISGAPTYTASTTGLTIKNGFLQD